MGNGRPRRAGGRTVLDIDLSELVWALYARESDADDLRQVTAQLAEMRPMALGFGGRIGKEFPENDTSAFKRKRVPLPDGTYGYRVVRPDWDEMMRDLRRGVYNAVAVVNLDRGMRDPRDLEDLIDLVEHYGVYVKSLTGNIDLTTDDGISAARHEVNQRNSESRNISRRVSAGNRRAAWKGRNHGGGSRSFGWRTDKVRSHKRESAAIRAALPRLLAGVKLRTLTKEWNAKGPKTVSGGNWSTTTLRQIFTNPRLCGWRTYHGVVLRDDDGSPIRGEWEPLLTENEFQALQAVLGSPEVNRVPSGRGKASTFLLSGVLRCGRCNRRMKGGYNYHRSGNRTAIYKCSSKTDGGCGGLSIVAADTDAYVAALVIAEQKRKAIRRPETVTPFAEAGRLREVAELIEETTAGFKARQVSKERFFTLIEDLEKEEAELKARQRRHDAKQAQRVGGPVDLEAEWANPDFPLEMRKAAILRSLMTVVVHPADYRVRTFNPNRLAPVWRDESAEDPAA